MPAVVALDFDGVISDSAPEAFAVALRTWCALRPESRFGDRETLLAGPAAPAREAIVAEPLYAAFLELMPLGNRAEDYAVELDALEATARIGDQAGYDAHKARIDPEWLRRFHRRFYRERRAMADADPARWHALMAPYPGVPGLLRRRADAALLAIATSKDRHSVGRLLAAYGIADLFPAERVLDKETGTSKRAHLEHLQRGSGAPWEKMVFVDDKVNHLDSVAPLGVRCVLAAWGYNGPREERLARERGYRVAGLAEAEAALFA